jgi:hypothetical protein
VLLPFWADVLGVKPIVVFEYRDPVAAAQSLRTRDHFTLRQGLALWERYMRHALQGVAGLPATLVDYNELLVEPDDCIQRVDDFLRTHGALDGACANRSGIAAFLDPSLRHHTPQDREHQASAASVAQRLIYSTLRNLTGKHGVFPTDIVLPREPASNEQVLRAIIPPQHQPVTSKIVQ